MHFILPEAEAPVSSIQVAFTDDDENPIDPLSPATALVDITRVKDLAETWQATCPALRGNSTSPPWSCFHFTVTALEGLPPKTGRNRSVAGALLSQPEPRLGECQLAARQKAVQGSACRHSTALVPWSALSGAHELFARLIRFKRADLE